MKQNTSTTARKVRRRADKPVVLRFRSDVEPNENHPLADVDPERRSQQRQTVIAAILARLAEAQSSRRKKAATIRLGGEVATSDDSDAIEE